MTYVIRQKLIFTFVLSRRLYSQRGLFWIKFTKYKIVYFVPITRLQDFWRYYDNFIKNTYLHLPAWGVNCGKINKIEKKYKLNKLPNEGKKINKQNHILLNKFNEDNLNFDDFHLRWMLLIVSPLEPFGQFVSHVTVNSVSWAVITSLCLDGHRHRN